VIGRVHPAPPAVRLVVVVVVRGVCQGFGHGGSRICCGWRV
jgi:hypothetical protein